MSKLLSELQIDIHKCVDSIIIIKSIINFNFIVPFLSLQKFNYVFTKSFHCTINVPQMPIRFRRCNLDTLKFSFN